MFTIGHSNHSVEAFLRLLQANGVELVVDVRSHPYSKYAPQFDRPALEGAVAAAGMRYLYLGRELGGRPEGPEFYDEEGHVLYDVLRESPPFLAGISRLIEEASTSRVAILCGEEDPTQCHRRFLVGHVLSARGVVVEHIRGDGRLQTEETLCLEELRGQDDRQLMLFAAEEVAECRSSPSVSQRKRRPSSSER